eukprot:758469-Hanusia_phi.AAC.1
MQDLAEHEPAFTCNGRAKANDEDRETERQRDRETERQRDRCMQACKVTDRQTDKDAGSRDKGG